MGRVLGGVIRRCEVLAARLRPPVARDPLRAGRLHGDGVGRSGFDFEVAEAKRAYKVTYQEIPADGMKLAVDAENYSRLPIVAVWGGDAHQSTLVGMRESIAPTTSSRAAW